MYDDISIIHASPIANALAADGSAVNFPKSKRVLLSRMVCLLGFHRRNLPI